MKTIVIADCHVLPEGVLSHGIDTGRRLAQAVADINTHHADADGCLFLGDLADDGAPASYERLAAIAADLKAPAHFAIGNHDDRAAFRKVFAKAPVDACGFVQFCIDAPVLRLVVLDSVDAGSHAGVLCADRLDWLAQRLAERPEADIYVLLHHHPRPVNMGVDEVMLRNPRDLHAVLRAHPTVKHVFSGHIHRPCWGLWDGIPFAAIGSTHYVTEYHEAARTPTARRFTQPACYAVLTIDADGALVHTHQYAPLEPAVPVTGVC